MNINVSGFLFSAFALMAVLKLIGYFPFSWWLVFSPLLTIGALLVIAVVLAAGGYFLINWASK